MHEQLLPYHLLNVKLLLNLYKKKSIGHIRVTHHSVLFCVSSPLPVPLSIDCCGLIVSFEIG